MKNLNLFRKSARGSEGSTLVSTVVRPSFDRRSTVVKHLAFMLLFLLGSLNVWGEDVEIVSTFAKVKNESPTASFTASNTGSNNVYSTGTTFTITSKENNVWTLAPSTSGSIYFSMNNSEGGFHLGSKNYDAGDATLTSSTSFLNVTQIKISGKTGKSGSVTISVKVGNTSISLKQGSSETFSGSTVATATFISASPISGTVEVTMTDGANNIAYYIESITITTSSDSSDPTACAEPTFSPVAGAVASGTKVTLTTTTEDADIYYTMGTNPADPTTGSTKYTAPISITEATTIKAIAVKEGYNNSTVATAAYTVVTPYTTIADLFEDMTTTSQPVHVTFGGWQVSVVKGNQAFVTDGTNGLIIYQSGHGLVEGDVLTGTVQCNLVKYNGAVELTGVTKTMDGISVASGVISPAVKTIPEANALAEINTGILVKLENVTYNGSAFVDESSNTIAPYTTFYNYSSALTSGHKYNVTGIIQQYSSNSQIYPRKAADIEEIIEVGAPEAPTFSVAAGTYTSVQSVELSCATEGATIYYTTDGATPTTESTVYSSAIEVGADMTIKAIAVKDDKESTLASATYVINIPLPSHDFQITHKFETGEGFEFPTGWSTSYEAHEIAFTDDKVVFLEANQPSSTSAINDCPVTKDKAISLVLTNTSKIITAVRFDYKQWGAKAQTLTMKYSTDGGATYNAFNPAVSSTNFALQVLDLPDGTNAIQVTGSNSSNQVGLTSIAFDLANKPVVKKTVTITPPSNGTLVVKNGEDAITSGDAIEVGSTLTIEATPNTGYSLSSISVKDEEEGDVEINEGAFVLPSKNVTVSATFVEDERPEATLILSVQGIESPYAGSYKVDDVVTLPSTATTCEGHVFAGWSEVEIVTPGEKPATKYYDKGESYPLSATTQTLYAVYADGTDAAWQITDDDLVQNAPSASSSYAKYAGDQVKDGKTFNITDVMPGTGSNAGKLQIKASSGVIYNKTAMSNDIASIEIDGVDLAVYESDEMISSQPEGDAITKTDGVYPFSNGNRFFFIKKTTTGAGYAASITVNLKQELSNYTTTCVAPIVVPEPEFDVAEGTYQAEQLIMIDNYDGNYIYVYTTDDSEPTLDSNLDPEGTSVVYDNNAGIEIKASCTLKARAYDTDGNYSDVTSAAYTINLPLTTIPAIFEAATSTQTEVNITMGNWVVSGVGVGSTTNEKTVYVTDGTNGFIIFAASHGFEVGDILSGTITCDLKKYNGSAELMDVTIATTGLIVTKGGTVTTASIVPNALAGVNTGALIALSNWKYDGEYLTDGTTSIKPFNTLFTFDALTENKYYNVTGIYLQFSGTKEILPRSVADIVELTQEAPTMTWYTSDAKTATIAANATYTINLGDAFAPVFETNSSGALTYSSSDPTIAEINETTGALILKGVTGTTFIKCAVAAAGDYTAGEQGFTLRVREAVAGENVVIVAKYGDNWYAMKNTGISSKAATAIQVTYADGKIWDLPTADQEAITWVRTVDGDNVTFQAPNGDYLKTSGNDLALEAGESGTYQWNWNSTYYRTGEQTRTFVYRDGYNFRSYAVSNAGQSGYSALPVVTAAVFATTPVEPVYEEVRSELTVGRHYTVCLPKKMTEVRGASFWKIENRDNAGTMVYLEEVDPTEFAAGTPFIIQATDTKLEVVYTGDATTTAGSNGALRGTLEDMSYAELQAKGEHIYLLIQNAIRPIASDNYLNAKRAYIDYDALNPVTEAPASIPGRRVKSMPMAPQVATGVDQVLSDQVPNTKVLINGQLFILHGEKMYDAKGQLVK